MFSKLRPLFGRITDRLVKEWKWLFVLLVDVLKDLLKDRYVGGINHYLDAHSEGPLGHARPIVDWILASPFGISILVLFSVVCAVIIKVAFIESEDNSQKENRDSQPPTEDHPPFLGESIQEEFPLPLIELTPSEGQGERMFLQVKNNDDQQVFHAQCRILDRRNDPNPKRLLTLDLNWERNGKRELEIRNGEICSFCVARAGQDRRSEIEWIEIVGSPEPVQSQWTIGNVNPLPEYDVEIIIFGSERKGPYSEKFLICAGRECAIEMISFSKLKSNKSNMARGIKVHLESMIPGLRMLWMERTFLFFHCRVVSPAKTTSIVSVSATLETSDGKVWPCDYLNDLSQWLLCPARGVDIELESQSLIAKFRQSPLVAEVQTLGWLGLEIPFPPTQERLDGITGVAFTLTDGTEQKHTTTLKPPFPGDDQTLIVAKHVRRPNAEL